MASQRIGTFTVSDRVWENQSEFLRNHFWTRILGVTWDDKRYWITAESNLFGPVSPGEVIPDYDIEMNQNGVTVRRLVIALAAA